MICAHLTKSRGFYRIRKNNRIMQRLRRILKRTETRHQRIKAEKVRKRPLRKSKKKMRVYKH